MHGGKVLTHPALARNRFREITGRPESELDLTEAALVIALEEYPSLDVDRYLGRIEHWSDAIRERVHGSRDLERVVEEINRLLFKEEGFHGEAEDYYDRRKAFLNDVLDSHAGLPITLSIVYMEISRRLGIDTSGVSLPGRFLVKVSGPWGEILIDPFEEGRVLSTVECQRLLDEVYGGGVRLREHHLRSLPKKAVLARLLSHLKALFMTDKDLEGALGAVDKLLLLDDRDQYELRDRGVIAMQLHRYEEAIEFLERYLALAPQAEDRLRIREEVAYLKSWLEQN